MNQSRVIPWPATALAFTGIVIGIVIMLAAMDIIPLDESRLHSPRFIFGLAGLAISATGGAHLFYDNKCVNAFCAAIILVCFARIGWWATMTTSKDNLGGGVPFVSREINVLIGKGIFGFGVLCSLMLMVWAIRQAIFGETTAAEPNSTQSQIED